MVTHARTMADVRATRLFRLRVRLNNKSETAMMALPAVSVSLTVWRKVDAKFNLVSLNYIGAMMGKSR